MKKYEKGAAKVGHNAHKYPVGRSVSKLLTSTAVPVSEIPRNDPISKAAVGYIRWRSSMQRGDLSIQRQILAMERMMAGITPDG